MVMASTLRANSVLPSLQISWPKASFSIHRAGGVQTDGADRRSGRQKSQYGYQRLVLGGGYGVQTQAARTVNQYPSPGTNGPAGMVCLPADRIIANAPNAIKNAAHVPGLWPPR